MISFESFISIAVIRIIETRKMPCFFWDLKKRQADIIMTIIVRIIGSKIREMVFVVVVKIGFSIERIKL